MDRRDTIAALEELIRAAEIALSAAKGDRIGFTAALMPYEEATVKAIAARIAQLLPALCPWKAVSLETLFPNG